MMIDSAAAGTVPVTRFEILDAVESAFGGPPVTKSQIVDTARDAQARAEVLHTLARLDDYRRFSSIRDLWVDLKDVPVE